MSRFVAIICLTILLICPVVCLTGTAGERCIRADGDLCESLATGAVVTDSADAPAPIHDIALCFDGLFTAALPPSCSPLLWSRYACDRMPHGMPLDAWRRLALLQSFLF